MRQRASLDIIADNQGAAVVLNDAEPEIERAGQAQEDSRSTSSTSSPAPPDNEESDFFLGANDSQSSLGVPNLQDMQVNDDECIPPVHRLPNEILIAVFAKLSSSSDILHVMLTCKRWARNAVDILWHRPSCTTWEKHTSICQTLGLEHPFFYYRDFIRRLNLASLADKVNDGSVMPLAACTRVERLTLTGCKNLTDSGLIALVTNNNHLYSLDISFDNQITEASVYAIADNCPRLQGLNVSGCTKISNESLIRLAQSCRYIKRLKLNECAQLTDEAVLAFAEHCPNILEIDLHQCRQIGNEPVTSIFTQGQALRELRLVGCELIDDSAFLSLPSNRKYEHLRILDLSSCARLTDRAVEKIIDVAPRLRNLVFAKCRNLTDATIYAISRLGKNLHFLHLGHCVHITDEAVKHLVAECNRIRYIDLGCCTHLTDDSVTKLANLPKLKRIGLVKCSNITDASVIALANANRRSRMRKDAYGNVIPGEYYSSSHSSLERVHLSYCTHLTLRSIIRLLNSCPRLTHLSLTGVQAFLREDLEQFSRDAPPEFTEHQRAVFCVFSGQGVVNLRKYLNNRQALEMSEMRASQAAAHPLFHPAAPHPGIPHLHTTDGAFDETEADAVDDDDGLEDGSEMVIDTQPLLDNHGNSLGVFPIEGLDTAPQPPPVLPIHSHAHHPVNNNPFGYVGGHPPYVPQQILPQDGSTGFNPPTPPSHDVPTGQEGGGNDMNVNPAVTASTASLAAAETLPHPPVVYEALGVGSSSPTADTSTAVVHMTDISTQSNQSGYPPGPALDDQTPRTSSPGSS
ncbi:SCF ubiquitin ligase complex subunit [Madurella fahalii]|uniref:SCF ubiquitin ligase complex subunit n=1 Tax=Madurella fahalii TaxID=1157608 RepID=A0ABQ0GAM7_9PEZI